MKSTILATLFFASCLTWADGPIAHQAAGAVDSAVKLFLTSQPQEIVRQFQAINASRLGHEQFEVVITLADGKTLFNYMCEENESVQPVTWDCSAR